MLNLKDSFSGKLRQKVARVSNIFSSNSVSVVALSELLPNPLLLFSRKIVCLNNRICYLGYLGLAKIYNK